MRNMVSIHEDKYTIQNRFEKGYESPQERNWTQVDLRFASPCKSYTRNSLEILYTNIISMDTCDLEPQ